MAVRIEANAAALAALFESAAGPVARELLRAAITVEATAKRITAGPGTGRTYQRGGVSHTASAPGEPFATDRGRLRSSITHSLSSGPGGLEAHIGSNVVYALDVEVGTRHMAARPYLRPALHSLIGGAHAA